MSLFVTAQQGYLKTRLPKNYNCLQILESTRGVLFKQIADRGEGKGLIFISVKALF